MELLMPVIMYYFCKKSKEVGGNRTLALWESCPSLYQLSYGGYV